MGLFDRFKKKVSETIDKASESFKKNTEFLNFSRLKEGLKKTRNLFSNSILKLVGGRKIDAQLLNEIEDLLITADIGVNTSELLINKLKTRVKEDNIEDASKIYQILKEEIYSILENSASNNQENLYNLNKDNKPNIIMIIGVNGVGKTTTIGKLAYNYKENNNKVLIASADTFRAAANDQLKIWSERANVEIVEGKSGQDPASVVFDSVKKAKDEDMDLVLVDTAGRLHNKLNLMQELEKFTRVIKKIKESGTDEVFLVLDATTGQNAIQQAKEFSKIAPITGIVLTKLDGTAKGGVVIAIANELKIPVKYIGVGEKINDLQIFDPLKFVEALFGSDDGNETDLLEIEN